MVIMLVLTNIGFYFTNAFVQLNVKDGSGIIFMLVAIVAVCYFVRSLLFKPIIFDFKAMKAHLGKVKALIKNSVAFPYQ